VEKCVVDTSRKFAGGVVDTGGNFAASVVDIFGALWLANIFANFWKKWNDPSVIFRGSEEDDSWKNSDAKNLVTLSLSVLIARF
jgi:hypothetical protein